jgi:hypothetical protein
LDLSRAGIDGSSQIFRRELQVLDTPYRKERSAINSVRRSKLSKRKQACKRFSRGCSGECVVHAVQPAFGDPRGVSSNDRSARSFSLIAVACVTGVCISYRGWVEDNPGRNLHSGAYQESFS